MYNSLLILGMALLNFPGANAQTTVKGKVLNGSSQEFIPFVNIGIANKNIGTITNSDGSFSLLVPKDFKKDTLNFSSLGFGEKRIAVAFFSSNKSSTIYLAEKSKVLTRVVVDAKAKRQTFGLGNKLVRGATLEADTTHAGRAMALLIDNWDSKLKGANPFPAYVEKAQLRIFRNNLKSFKFRVRINNVDSSTGGPGEELLGESVVVESSIRKG